MNTFQQTVMVPPDRRLQIDLPLPDSVPVGQAEVVVILSPIPDETPKSIRHLAGCLADSKTFAGDPVALQKAIRDEW
ncbi:MAG: hypothetical protein FWC56_04775 [Phycisphaerae bacterium]|nr:hypothetical protein [Phycisphaerae bacterium]